jgi:glycosyltransferase involved in cell wall biosynthesis
MAKGNGQILVVDIDDWFDCLPPTNRARLTTDPKLNPQNNTDIYFEIIENVDAIICSTPALHDFYKQKYPHKMVFMIRNAIDIQRWTPKQQPVSTPVIGWVGATPWRAFDLEELSGFMDRFLQSNNTTFHHAGAVKGAKSAHSLLRVDTKRFSFEFMQPITNLPYLYRNIDIGVVPLQDIPFNQAKSYLKGLEYVAAGIPFVASATEEYRYLADKGIGRVANSEEEWENHLQELMDYEIRKHEAHRNRLALLKSFTMENMSVAWNDAFTQILNKITQTSV